MGMSGRKESEKERETGNRILKSERFNLFLILFLKRLEILNNWNISFASAKPNVVSY